MKYIIFVLTFCLMVLIPQESFAVLAPAKADAPAYEEMTRAEKRAFRKDLRKRIKAAKKSDAPSLEFDSYWTMGIAFSLVGLVGIVVGNLVEIGILSWLGGLVLAAGLTIMILSWLEVI